VTAAADGELTVLTRRDGTVGWLTLNRPEKRNALTLAMRADLDAALAEFAADEAVRVVVLTGAGSAFCAGVDLSGTDLSGAGPSGRPGLTDGSRPVAAGVAAFGKPIVAAVNGPAAGGGLELALACDIRIASREATFALPEVRIGSLPGSGGTQRLMRVIQPAVAARMLLTGEPLAATEALRVGLVSDLVDADLTAHAADLAARIAANAPLSLRAMKQCLLAAREAPLASGLDLERTLWALLASTDDRQEGRAAFRERRAPRFTGN
jgi:enoyl-CoA hydratase/carnithine racemase